MMSNQVDTPLQVKPVQAEGSESGKSNYNLCRSCGMCCDGTLFSFVKLEQNEKKIQSDLLMIKNKSAFMQPCSAFSQTGDCKVYSKRPKSCQKFNCKLLKDFKKGNINEQQTKRILDKAKKLRQSFFKSAKKSGLFSSLSQFSVTTLVNYNNKYLLTKECRQQHTQLLCDYASLKFYLNKFFYSIDDL